MIERASDSANIITRRKSIPEIETHKHHELKHRRIKSLSSTEHCDGDDNSLLLAKIKALEQRMDISDENYQRKIKYMEQQNIVKDDKIKELEELLLYSKMENISLQRDMEENDSKIDTVCDST
jgi:hypothetical protein